MLCFAQVLTCIVADGGAFMCDGHSELSRRQAKLIETVCAKGFLESCAIDLLENEIGCDWWKIIAEGSPAPPPLHMAMMDTYDDGRVNR